MSSLDHPITLEDPIIWPPLAEEIKPFRKYCKGLVLNAGSGQRALGLGKRELNIDIVPDTKPDIIGDLHAIPLIDESIDTIVSIAVLEHTKFPWIVAEEFYRVLKPGGYGVINVPFLQPQHACPSDFMRFTENGLVELMQYVGFEVVETAPVHHFGQTIAWLLWKYLEENPPKSKIKIKLWFWFVRQLSKGNFLAGDSSNTHNSHYVVVRKPGTSQQTSEAQALLQNHSKNWFFPLLSCPNTRQSLHLKDNSLISADGSFTYQVAGNNPILLPNTDPKTWKTRVDHGSKASPVPTPVPTSSSDVETQNDAIPVVPLSPELHFLSNQAFEVSFKLPYEQRLKQANPNKIAVLATSEYEGIFRNGGVGTHYKTLSEQLAKNGWHVVLFLCTYDQTYGGASSVEAVSNIFAIQDLPEVLNLQPIHQAVLANFCSEWKHWIDHPSFASLLFTQAISNLFPDLPIYVEFHEMTGTGYHTIQAKQSGLLRDNCVIGVTMHSGHEWIYEANEWFAEEYLAYYAQACDYEQFTFENADLTFFPSHYLKEKVESYGWKAADSKHMPYFIPILKQNDFQSGYVQNDHQDKVPVIFFGRLEMRKGIMTFVEAIKQLGQEIRSQIHVHFIGKVVQLHTSKFGDLKSDRYIQQELEGKVTYTIHSDFYSHQAIQFIRSLRSPIVCLASHQENFPNTGLEMGQLPVSLVVSDTGGFRETLKFVNRQSGIYWFKPADPSGLADMVSKAFFNQPEVPEVPSLAELEAINIELWQHKLSFIEAAFNQKETAQTAIQTSQPKVTIGVTCHNQMGKYLMDCLISLGVQTYDNFEVVVLDDASPDLETQQAIEQAKSIFSTYKFIRSETNLGPDQARHHLAALAEGDYFLPLDANHRLTPFAVETFVHTAIYAQAEVVISPRVVFGARSFVDTSLRQTSVPTMLQIGTPGGICSLFSTTILERFQYSTQREGNIQDWCILSAAIATGAKIAHYPYPLYEYQLSLDAISHNNSYSKERYYLRQYLAQIPPAEWSSRQLNMMMMAIQDLHAQQIKLQQQVQQAQAETQQVQTELTEMKQKLQKARGNVKGMRANLECTQTALHDANERIRAMETSKFWKIRKGWFKVKKLLNLPLNE